MSFQKTHNNYRNGGCIHKRSCRYILEGLLSDQHITHLSSLTLPALGFDLEHKLLSRYESCRLHLCEVNPKVFAQQKQDIIFSRGLGATRSIEHYNTNVLDLQLAGTNFIWLDLCGYLTESLFTSLTSFLDNNQFDDRGVFAITLLSARENDPSKKFFSRLQRSYLDTQMTTLQNFRSIQLPKILEKALNDTTGLRFELATNYNYKPSSGGGLMTMYAFNWSRE